jgi:hypothetical protein
MCSRQILYCFSVAPKTNYCMFNVFKQYIIHLELCRSESQHRPYWDKIRVLAGLIPPGDCREESISLSLPAFEGYQLLLVFRDSNVASLRCSFLHYIPFSDPKRERFSNLKWFGCALIVRIICPTKSPLHSFFCPIRDTFTVFRDLRVDSCL